MGIFGKSEGSDGQFLFSPKLGESVNIVILGVVERIKSDKVDFCYKKQGIGSMGYYDILKVVNEENGEETNLLINTWKLYFALKEFEGLDVGDTIEISHPSRGVYEIKKS